MSSLRRVISDQITRFGPISVADYMTLCLLHPRHGYYMTHDPLGADGDFTTAPEISQMFGEMLGLCLIQSWQDQGRPPRIILAELGPGRGTLMADILRVAATVPGFLEAAEIWLVEASPALREIQQKTLEDHHPNWAAQITELPEAPLFLVANEFFDALPVRQYRRTKAGWQEQMIGLDGDRLVFGLAAPLPFDTLAGGLQTVRPGDMVETCAAAQAIVTEIAGRIARAGGVALVVDYGSDGSLGDTFQAVAGHQKVDPLADPGRADLSAHVDFAALAYAARAVSVSGTTSQGLLLERLGITDRAQALADRLSGERRTNHIAAHRRLTHRDEMGTLFKAIALYPHSAPTPAGFDIGKPHQDDA